MSEPEPDFEIPALWRCPSCYHQFEQDKTGNAICPECGWIVVKVMVTG